MQLADRVLIVRLNQDGSAEAIQESVSSQYPSLNRMRWTNDCFPQTAQQYYRQGIPRIVSRSSVSADERTSCLLEFMREIGVQSKIVAPIMYGKANNTQQVWGLLVVHTCSHYRQWQTLEAEFLQQISNQLAIAIDQANLYQQLQTELNERRQAEAALRNSEIRFRIMFAEAPAGIVLVTAQGQIAQANQSFCEMLGYSEPELQGGTVWSITHPQDVESEQALFHQLFNHKIGRYTLEKRLVKRNGGMIWVQLTSGLLQDPDNGDFYKLGMYENITERRLVEQMKDNFVSVVSHELRTPLTSIRAALKLLIIDELQNLTSDGQELLNIAVVDSQRLVRLVNDLLDLERIRSGHLSLVEKSWNVVDLITQSVDSMRSLTEEANIHLEISTDPIIVNVDGDRIVQTIINLLNNSIKFSSPNTTVSIRTELITEATSISYAPTPCVLFSIRDQGRGIPPNKLQTIFEPFEQVDASDSRQKGGSGLGLAICQSIVQRHGGSIWATSTLGQGSCFFFILPVNNRRNRI